VKIPKVIALAAVVAAIAVAVGHGGRPRRTRRGRAEPATSARLSWGEKCLRAGEYCRIRADREYHRYHFHCHTGRLSRSAGGGNATGAGCEPGYSPCLPRVADLNCNDVPASKKPIRVTGSDPYRLDGDGDGWGCEP
jgi:hypothetical protein